MKFSRQTDYVDCVIAELSKYVKTSMQISQVFFLLRILQKQERPVSRSLFFWILWRKMFFCNITKNGQISLPDCVYFPSHSRKCISCFMLRQMMISWNLNNTISLLISISQNVASLNILVHDVIVLWTLNRQAKTFLRIWNLKL